MTTVATPLITTIIPTYRRPLLLQRAVMSALSQTLRDLRVLVIDDASGDETDRVMHELAPKDDRIVYVQHEKNIGLAANFQYGLKHITTPFFSFLSDDDALLPNLYADALAEFDRHPQAMFVVLGTVTVGDTGHVLGISTANWRPGFYPRGEGLMAMAQNGAPIWTSVIFRRAVLEELEGLDPEIGVGIDRDFLFRAAARFPYVVSGIPGALFRVETLKPNGARHPYPFHGIWPGWPKMLAKIGSDPAVAPALRPKLISVLDARFVLNLPSLGLRYVYTGQPESAAKVAEVLSRHYQRRHSAWLIRFVLGLRRWFGSWLISVMLGIPYQLKGLRRRLRAPKSDDPAYRAAREVVELYRVRHDLGT